MTKNIYTLLVGIDAYNYPVPPLQGCVNDIKAIEEYLQGRVAQDNDRLYLRTLINQDATRQGIVETSTSRSLETSSNWMSAKGEYIFLSACRDRELAKEYNASEAKRGVFSYFLIDTLKRVNGSLTYRDLFKRTDALVRSKVTDQSPQIESQESAALDRPFLGGAISTSPAYFTVTHQPNYGWVIDGGAVHGVSVSNYLSQRRKDAEKNAESINTTELAVFLFETPVNELSQPEKAIASASVVKVMPQLSQIEVEGLQPETIYKAIVTSLPLPPKGVLFTGETKGVELARQALQKQSSLYITEVDKPEAAEWQLIAHNGQYIITRPVDDRPLITPFTETDIHLSYYQENGI